MVRRIFFASFMLFFIGATAQAPLPRELRDVVERAIAGEREAIARYESFAAKAETDGYPGVASLFRAQARAEKVHLDRFTQILESRGLPVPEPRPGTPTAGDTADNLRQAVAAERSERDGIYQEALSACRLHRAEAIAKVFDQTRDTEVEHANLCDMAVRQLASFKGDKTYFVCSECGYTTDIRLGMCPLCRGHEVTAVH